jgi:hypothetical protein
MLDACPSRLVLTPANTFVNGRELRHFSGGRETNNFLIARGFPVILKKQTGRKIGIEAEDEDDAEVYAEGRVSYALHRKLERNPKIAKKVKNKRLREKGDLCCDVCGFSFHERYGAIGIGFIEAHHTVPVPSLKGRQSTKLADMALVCSNSLDAFTLGSRAQKKIAEGLWITVYPLRVQAKGPLRQR